MASPFCSVKQANYNERPTDNVRNRKPHLLAAAVWDRIRDTLAASHNVAVQMIKTSGATARSLHRRTILLRDLFDHQPISRGNAWLGRPFNALDGGRKTTGSRFRALKTNAFILFICCK
jgi:hypothetical protein